MLKKHRGATPSYSIGSKTDSRRTSSLSDDEGYISICFDDNGTFYIDNGQMPEKSDYLECSSTQIRRKFKYEEDFNNFEEDDGVEFEASSDKESFDEKGEDDEESMYFDPESPASGISEESYDDNEHHRAISHESNTSDDSASSFAFPVLGRVWSGSPIKMPRTTGMHLRKHKHWRLIFLCCRRF